MPKQNLKAILKTALIEAFSNNIPLVVWYDNGGTLENLTEHVTPKNVELIKYRGSYLTIRAKIEQEKDFKKKRLIYVPEKAPDPSWLRDYEIFGNRLDMDLPAALSQYFRLGIDRELRNILRPPNCRRLAKRWDEVLGDVEIPLSTDALKQALLATIFEQPHEFDPKRAIFTYLKHHDTLSPTLEKSGLSKIFLETLRGEYGYKPTTGEKTVDPKRLAATILLTELVLNSGGLAEKEFSDILPPKKERKFWASLVPQWASNEDFKDSFIQWSQQLEKEYDILTKVRGRPEIENVTSFKAVDEALLEEILIRIGNEGLKGIRKNATFIKTLAGKREQQIWSRSGLFPEWKPITLAMDLLQLIQESLTALEKKPDATSLLENYSKDDGWWHIDQLYRDLATIDAPIKPKVRQLFIDLPREQYQEWLRKLNNTFTIDIEKQQKWQIKGVTTQRNFWQNFVHPHKEKIAVFLLDAFRYELQKRLTEELNKARIDIKHHVMLASLPSITEVAMSSLLPGDTMKVSVFKGDLNVSLDGKPVLTKNDRINWLKDKFADKVSFLDLKDLQRPVAELRKELSAARILVLMDREIDKAGSFITEELLDHFDKLLFRVKKAVETVAKLGYNKMILTTDHGFLFLPMPDKIDMLESIPSRPETLIGKRYAIGKPPIVSGALTLTNKTLTYMSEGTRSIFPIGILWFPRPGPKEPFVHGGISLQECCIGVIECTPKKGVIGEKVGVKVSFPSVISSMIFVISLRPVMKQISDLPRSIVVELLEENQLLLRSDPIEIYDKEESLTLKLPRIPKKIEVRVKDSETEEVLFHKTAKVSLEGYDEIL
jgi:hypothetical protein